MTVPEYGDAPVDLNDGFGELGHLEIDDKLLKVSDGAITFLLNDQLTLWFSVTLNFAFEAIAAITNISLNLRQFLF